MSVARFRAAARVLPLAAAAVLAACAGGPAREPWRGAEVPPADAARMVASIRAAAGDGEGELAVQPLRDPRVEDLRQQAGRLEAAGQYRAAAEALDRALEIVDADPALLQERAELALLLGEFATADALAQRAYALGAQVGPLCRRHWATLEQLRLLAGDAEGAASAREQVAGCRVAGPERY
ncbi:hypothetical protein QFW77_04310 [Luteimonas sp. RD2P54]|uniref:Tetratricopeptide repeat protein n=1 Tax=Luteimonas endophytica TaxID=3042023 RepID=A0ABT6J5V5_9GAMM|nr:hypothetical protein [Luteimonas endophytica]MDH5822212.1 hypothetical protein [Luteimonas endophytica]